MSSRAFVVARSVGSLSLGLSLVGCSLAYCDDDAFARDRELRHGEIAGTALLPGPEEKPAAFVQASVQGTSFVRRTSSEGRFVFSGLEEGPWIVTVSEDDNGDGKAERRRVVSAILRNVPHRTSPSYVPLVAGEGVAQLAGIDVGEVLLEGTVRVSGRVLLDDGVAALPPSQQGRVAVVVVGRNLDLPRLESDGTDLVSLGAEAKTGVDDQGNFVLRNVSGGAFYLLVLIYEEGTPGQPGALLHVGEPVAVEASGDVEVAQDIVIPAEALAARRPAQLVFSPPPSDGERVYLVLVPPGRELPPCEDAPIDYSGTPFPYALTTSQIPASAAPQFQDVPVGLWDMQACFTSSPAGTLFAQTITPPVSDEPPVLLGPVLLSELQACVPARPCDADTPCGEGFVCDETAGRCQAPEGWSDCDGDDARGLPRIADEDDRAIWVSCVSQCFASAGVAAADTTCDASDGNTYDCDDDGDGICDGTDPFPECRANTAAACEAGAEPDVPGVPSDYGSGDSPGLICEAERTVDVNEASYCDASGTSDFMEQCTAYTMACRIDTQFQGPVVVVPRCDAATGLGCGDDPTLFCARELADANGIAPCAQSAEVPCDQTTVACPDNFICRSVVENDAPRQLCASDLDDPDFEALVLANIDCSCCRPDEGCHPVPLTQEVLVPGACTDDELLVLWETCWSGSGQGGTDAGSAGTDLCGPDGLCDQGCETPDPDCDGTDPDGGIAPPTQCADELVITEFSEIEVNGVGAADCLRIEGDGMLEIVGLTGLTRLDLGDVRVIYGSVLIQNNDSLDTILAPALSKVQGSLTIDDNEVLTNVDAPALNLIEGDLGIWRNPILFVDPGVALVQANTVRVSANACSTPDDCAAFELPHCAVVGGFTSAVCYGCVDDSVCGGSTCDVNYAGAGTGTFTCLSTGEGALAVCGDSVPEAPEECDDGNTASEDGCSATCGIEPGYSCDSGQPSICTPTP